MSSQQCCGAQAWPQTSAITLFLNSLLLFCFFLLLLFWFTFLFRFGFVFLSVLSPRVWSLGASAKKQGEDLADNDGDEDEGISVLEAATA